MSHTSLNTAAKRLYDPGKALAAEKGIPVERSRNAPTAMPLGSFKLPSGVTVNAARFEHYTTILRGFERRVTANPHEMQAALHDLAQRLLDLHIEEQRGLNDTLHQEYQRPAAERLAKTRAQWRQAFEQDPEIGKNRRQTTITRARGVLAAYGRDAGAERLRALQDHLTEHGSGDHPEVLRLVDWVGRKLGKAAR